MLLRNLFWYYVIDGVYDKANTIVTPAVQNGCKIVCELIGKGRIQYYNVGYLSRVRCEETSDRF
jgi:serine protease inhibitor ecotin